ncbi:MAG: glycyl-radical enzyme activating protein [Clostridiales bacterium]|nr:glycyl-radical enzyme activating protein [Clostridiales bacterium]
MTLVSSIQRFSVNDGPGVRTVVFMKGCSLHCYWCHNPESIKPLPQIQFFAAKCISCQACASECPIPGGLARFKPSCKACGKCAKACYSGALKLVGKNYLIPDLVSELQKDKGMMDRSGGGVTFSGGEPLLHPQYVSQAMSELKREGISSCIETAGNVPWDAFQLVLPLAKLFLFDVKAAQESQHRRGTGSGNGLILSNLKKLREAGAPVVLRVPVVPGFNCDVDSIAAIGKIALLPGNKKQKIELLPFHGMCAGKYESLGLEFPAADTETPDEATMERLRRTLRDMGLDA